MIASLTHHVAWPVILVVVASVDGFGSGLFDAAASGRVISNTQFCRSALGVVAPLTADSW